MCLEIMIKREQKYYLKYLPDAVAVTDVPNNLGVLIKQRRRWLNGSLFGTLYVIENSCNIVCCCRAKHNVCQKTGLFLFLIYYLLTFIFFIFSLGWMYCLLNVFLETQVNHALSSSSIEFFQQLGYYKILSQIFEYGFIFIILMTIIVSLTAPVERSLCLFRFLMIFFGFVVNIIFVSVAYSIFNKGFIVDEKKYDDDGDLLSSKR